VELLKDITLAKILMAGSGSDGVAVRIVLFLISMAAAGLQR
jgi:hypothetical protein